MSACQCGEAHGACAVEYQYAVKIVCGQVVASAAGGFTPVAPGQYWTAINVHNPDKCKAATFRWKIVVALPGATGPIPVFQKPVVLGPDMAMEIDNEQILHGSAPPLPPFVKGYVVLESDVELDVVAVYTGSNGPCGSNSFATERVPARCVAVCEDLVLPLNTGIAAWQTVVPAPGPVQIITSHPSSWGAPPFGSSWVSQLATDGGGNPNSVAVFRYELCFTLCFGFDPPAPFPIQVIADNYAVVSLTNATGSYTIVTTPATGWSGPPTNKVVDSTVATFAPGKNCLRVDVPNGPVTTTNPTGFALAGLLMIPRGKCPCSPLPMAGK
jgi:hypothetical protein